MSFYNKKISKAPQVIIFSLASVLALFIAYFFQYFLEVNPCPLCIYERYLYWSVLIFALLFSIRKLKLFVIFIWIAYFTNFLLTTYHLGVEFKIFNLPQVCQVKYQNIKNWEDLYKKTISSDLKSCDKPTFFVKGVSFTTVNLIYLTIILVIASLMRKNNETEYKRKNY